MMMHSGRKTKGFTLIEILLVLAISTTFLVLLLNYTTQKSDELRRDKTVFDMQQILNAGLAFYINNSFWPLFTATINNPLCGTSQWFILNALQPNYLPRTLQTNSYGSSFFVNCSTLANGGSFYVRSTANTVANARVIAGRLPLAFITNAAGVATNPPTQPAACAGSGSAGCNIVVASVTIPGQNLSNARSVNFAGIYYNGSCVPAPVCPPGMRPAIFVTPTSVSGIITGDPPAECNPSGTGPGGNPADCSGIRTYPISSFVAFARGVNDAGDPAPSTGAGATIQSAPRSCATVQPVALDDCNAPPWSSLPATEPAGTRYWRVCLVVMTEAGRAYPAVDNYSQGKLIGSIMAMTRCVPNNETPSGALNVFQPNANWQP
ncbi:MAG: hypothetical protein ACD_60C00153G0012 [uncultured bacterium]|nr:MAG: hypothetical protein ACD_60C00153G0012 [uncultured bacterium]